MSLIQSAKLNGLDPYAYLENVLQRRVLNVAPHHCRDDRRPLLQGQCSSALRLASQLSDAEKT